MDIRQRLWASACMIEEELASRISSPAQPPAILEVGFNGGVAPDVARHYSSILTAGGLPDTANILDMGCGFGRIAMALTQRLSPSQRYFGLDPNAEGIHWAKNNITPNFPNFTFQRSDIKSRPYNPDGVLKGHEFRFPFMDASLDLVFMISVLTHVDLATVANYLREAARTLKPDTGRLVATIFLTDDEVDRLLDAGRGHFRMATPYGPSRVENPANPELAIAHPRCVVLDILRSAGFAQSTVLNGHWSGREGTTPMDFQDLIIAHRNAGASYCLPSQPIAPKADDGRATQRICDRIVALTGGDDACVSRFITWFNAVNLNAFWWQCDDMRFGTAAKNPWQLSFAALRKLGLEKIRPTDTKTAGSYHQLDDAAMIALLIKAGRVVSRQSLQDCFFEAAENGIRILDAISGEGGLFLQSPGCAAVPAPVPVFRG